MPGAPINAVADFDVDNSGAAFTLSAWQDAVDSANDDGRQLYLPGGCYKITGPIDRTLRTTLVGDFLGCATGQDTVDTATTHRRDYTNAGTVIALHDYPGMADGVGADAPWLEFGLGSGVRDLVFVQPDQDFTRIYPDAAANASGGDGGLAYVNSLYTQPVGTASQVIGNPKTYPPCIQLGFTGVDGGHSQGGRIIVQNVQPLGVYDFIGGVDNFPGQDGATIAQKGASDLFVENIRGCVLHTTFDLAQGGVQSTIRAVRLTPAFFSDAGGLDPLQRAFRWMMRNHTVAWVKNRAVGLHFDDMGIHGARRIFRVSGGWIDPDGDGSYRGLVSGRYNAGLAHAGVESCPTFLTLDLDGFIHRIDLTPRGIFTDPLNRNCTDDVLELLTDGSIAGNLTHSKDGSDRIFRTMKSVHGWRADFHFGIQRACGRVLAVASTDAHSLFKCDGFIVCAGVGDPTRPMFQLETGDDGVASRVKLKMVGMEIGATRGSSPDVFDVPNAAQLRCIGVDFVGVGELVPSLPGLDLSDERVFTGCNRVEAGWTAGMDVDDDNTDNPTAGANVDGGSIVAEGANPGLTYLYTGADDTPDNDGVVSAVVLDDDTGDGT